jgi:glycosyltransferase involved in cell wall biosynthesis
MHLFPVNSAQQNNPIHMLEIIGNAAVGGMENYLKNFLTHLPEEDFRITCICPYESPFTETLRKLGVANVYVTPVEDDPQWRSLQLVMEVARSCEIDLLHAHMPKAHVLAGIVAQFVNKPVVATVHGMHITAHELGITRMVNSHLITNCLEARTQALALGVPAERVNMVRNGVDVNVFKPGIPGDNFRKAIGISSNVPLVGFVGRLEFEKGPDLFLYAAEYIHYHMPDVHFVIAGEGDMRKELTAMCTRFRLQKHVHFVEWYENTAEIYAALNVLAHTSRSDGTSLVLLEAMACECLTAGFSVGGVQEIIENRSTGLLAGPGDWEGLGRRIIQLLEKKPEEIKKMGEAARERVKKYFNVETNTLRTAEILQSIAGAGLSKQKFSGNGNGTLTRKKVNKASAADSNTEAG